MAVNTHLQPPVITSPQDADEVEILTLEGTGVAGAVIQLLSSFTRPGTWDDVGTVPQNGTFKISPISDFYRVPNENAWIQVRQKTWWPDETSTPTNTINFTKLLERPVIKNLSQRASLPQTDQILEGTGMFPSLGSSSN